MRIPYRLRRILDPADLEATGYVDRDRTEDGDVPIPFQEELSRRFWYRVGWNRWEAQHTEKEV